MGSTLAGDGTRIAFHEWGSSAGEPLIFVQGLGADSRAWLMQWARFGRRFRCIGIDNRGVGRSDRPPGPYDLQVMADDVLAVMDHLGIESAHVVGASMGGVIAQLLTIGQPTRVRSLVLACSACRHHSWRRALLEDWRHQAVEHGMKALLRQNMHWILGDRSRRKRLPAYLTALPLAARLDPHAFASQVSAILGLDDTLAERLEGIAVPTLVIVGDRDRLTPVEDSHELAQRIPAAELVVVPGATHGFMFENARAFNGAILAFHERIEAAVPAERVAEVIDLSDRRPAVVDLRAIEAEPSTGAAVAGNLAIG